MVTRLERLAPLAGALAGVLWLVGILVLQSGNPADQPATSGVTGPAVQPGACRYRSLAERRRSAAASITSQASTPLHSHAAAARRSRFIAWSLSI
jgi:hypothetical protein